MGWRGIHIYISKSCSFSTPRMKNPEAIFYFKVHFFRLKIKELIQQLQKKKIHILSAVLCNKNLPED